MPRSCTKWYNHVMSQKPVGQVVGRVVRRALSARRMSQNELAKRARVSQAAVSRLLGGQRTTPSSSLIVAIADGLGMSVDELLGRRRDQPADGAARRLQLRDYLAIARAHQADLKREGIRHLAVFGSVVHDSQRDGSDIDVLIDLDQRRSYTLFDLGGMSELLRDLFRRQVDLVCRDSLHPVLRERILGEAVRAF